MRFIVFVIFVIIFKNYTAQTLTWNGSVSSDWGNASNWTPVGIPGAGNTVVINSGAVPNMPVLDASRVITTLTMSNGILDLNGFTLSTTTNASMTGGTIQNGTLSLNSFTAIANMIFNGPISLIKTGGGNNDLAGGNSFNGTTRIEHNGTGRIRFGVTNPDVFNGPLTLVNTSNNFLDLSYSSASNQFNNSITLEATSGTGIRFGVGGGSSVLNSGNTLSIGAAGFSVGELSFRNFNQLSATSQSLILTGTSLLSCYNSEWEGNVNFISPQILSSGTVYRQNAYLEKTGATGNNSPGGNDFHGITEIRNSGSAELRFGNGGANPPDIFRSQTTLTNSGYSYIRICFNTSGNEFRGNLILNSTAGTGIRFGEGGGTTTLTSGNTVSIGGLGFSSGELRFQNFTQLGATSHNLNLTGTCLLSNYESDWSGNVDLRSPQILTRGTNYRGTTYLEKTGATGNNSAGGNHFFGTTELRNSGNAEFRMGNAVADAPDIFNGATTFTNSGSSLIRIAYSSINNEFNNNVILNSTSGTGIRIGENNGSATLSAGNSFSIGGLGFSSGELRFRNLTQIGLTPQTLLLTGTSLLSNFESDWSGNVDFRSPQILTRGTNYRGTCYLEKTGATDNDSNGGNTFFTTSTIANSGSARLRMGSAAANPPDIFNGQLTLRNTGSGRIWMADVSAGNQFNGNVVVECNSGVGIYFGRGNGNGTLSAGNSFLVGGLGFSMGELHLRNISQVGGTAQTLTLSGTATLNSYDSQWSGNVSFTSPRILSRGSTYSGTVLLHKTSTGTDNSQGGNTFNQFVEIRNSSTSSMMDANTLANNFFSHVLYRTTSTGTILPSNNTTSNYHGDIRVNTSNQLVLGSAASGRINMIGSTDQFITDEGASPLSIFRRITVNKPSGNVILNVPISISNDLNLVSGNIISTNTNLLIMNNASVVSSVSDASFVEGPVRKIGNQAFTFPIGKNGFYRPASISNPTTNTHHFTAEYFSADPDGAGFDDTALESPIVKISDCEYWIIDRTNGASAVSVTLSYKQVGPDQYDCSAVESQPELLVARWDGAMWRNHGNGGTTGSVDDGTVVSSGTISSFSPFTLATSDLINPLPIVLQHFDATLIGNDVHITWSTATERDNDYFIIERSLDGINWLKIAEVKGAGNSNQLLNYVYLDMSVPKGVIYYRLKQVDFNGFKTAFDPKSVERLADGNINIYPNPASNNFNITNNSNRSTTIMVYSIDGKEIETILLNSNEVKSIDCSSWSKGTYILKQEEGFEKENFLKLTKL